MNEFTGIKKIVQDEVTYCVWLSLEKHVPNRFLATVEKGTIDNFVNNMQMEIEAELHKNYYGKRNRG